MPAGEIWDRVDAIAAGRAKVQVSRVSGGVADASAEIALPVAFSGAHSVRPGSSMIGSEFTRRRNRAKGSSRVPGPHG